MSLALRMGHRHPLIPTGPHTCLLYSRLQTTLESTGQRAKRMKAQEETAEVGSGDAKKSLRRSCRPAAGQGGKDQGGEWFGW
ncbi:hypothetical protein ACRRTK_009856 [Alexandromys fortis]